MRVLDNYALQCFRDCPRYYNYRIVHGIVRRDVPMTAAQFGIAVHLAIELVASNKADVPEAIAEACKYFAPFELENDDKRTCGKLQTLLSAYFEHYQAMPYEVQEVEIGFAVPLTDDVTYSGRIDQVVKQKGTDDIYGLDVKTTSSIVGYTVKPHNQFTGYIYGLSAYYERVSGFIVDLIGVYKDRPKVLKSGEWATGKGPQDCLLRIPTTRTQNDIDEWLEDTKAVVKQIELCEKLNVFPKNTAYCSAYRSKCQYIELCMVDEPTRQRLMENENIYEKSVWEAYSTEKPTKKGGE